MSTLLMKTSMNKSLRAVRMLFRDDNQIDLFVEKQLTEFNKLRKKHHDIARATLIKISMLNTAVEMQQHKFDIEICVASSRTKRSKPKTEWLLDHEKFIMDLRAEGLSYRGIEKAVLYRFRRKISHTAIANFVHTRIENVV